MYPYIIYNSEISENLDFRKFDRFKFEKIKNPISSRPRVALAVVLQPVVRVSDVWWLGSKDLKFW